MGGTQRKGQGTRTVELIHSKNWFIQRIDSFKKLNTKSLLEDWEDGPNSWGKAGIISCLSLCDPMDYSLPGSSVHRLLQAGILERLAVSFSRRSFWSRARTRSPALQANSLPSELPGNPNDIIILTVICGSQISGGQKEVGKDVVKHGDWALFLLRDRLVSQNFSLLSRIPT